MEYWKSVGLRKWVYFWQLNTLSAYFLILGKIDPAFVVKLVNIMGGGIFQCILNYDDNICIGVLYFPLVAVVCVKVCF